MVEPGSHILIVDDAALVRRYYRETLEAAGFTIDEAVNGLEAFERILIAMPDMLIVDINMPQMDGISFLTELRRKPRPLCSIPALVTSSESKSVDFDAARLAGANSYCVKSVDRALLTQYAMIFCGAPR